MSEMHLSSFATDWGLPKPSLGRTDCKPTSVSYYVGQYLAYWRLVTLNLTFKQVDTWGPSGEALTRGERMMLPYLSVLAIAAALPRNKTLRHSACLYRAYQGLTAMEMAC